MFSPDCSISTLLIQRVSVSGQRSACGGSLQWEYRSWLITPSSLIELTLFAAAFVRHEPSPVAKTIAALLSHLISTLDVVKHSDSLNVVM